MKKVKAATRAYLCGRARGQAQEHMHFIDLTGPEGDSPVSAKGPVHPPDAGVFSAYGPAAGPSTAAQRLRTELSLSEEASTAAQRSSTGVSLSEASGAAAVALAAAASALAVLAAASPSARPAG